MRIKKISIIEAAANTNSTTAINTSKTTDVKSNLLKPEDIEKSKKAIEDLDKKIAKTNDDIENGPMGAFLTKENVNMGNHIVQFDTEIPSETEFEIDGVRWKYVWAIYPDGKRDIGVYRIGHDLVYGYDWFVNNVLPRPKVNLGQQSENENQFGGEKTDVEAGESGYEREEQGKQDYQNWLSSPEGQDYMNKLSSIDESAKSKRKVIKTIKVKDLK
jgi:hypothetical protein